MYSKNSVTRRGNAFSFGLLSPGQKSETLIIQLKVSNALFIGNIKLCLIDSGGLSFKKNIFGVDILNYLDINYEPKQFFEGVNTNKNISSSYNVKVDSQNRNSSQFAYLNINIPSDYPTWEGTVRYGWFYDKG